MTEQEITQAREDLQQLDIEQLRCGVMLQLLNIEALTTERDALALGVDQWRVDYHELRLECDALAAAAKLALDALDEAQKYAYNVGKYLHGVPQAITSLRQAGVQ